MACHSVIFVVTCVLYAYNNVIGEVITGQYLYPRVQNRKISLYVYFIMFSGCLVVFQILLINANV